MILKIYTIHDRAAEAFLAPFFLHYDGMATRSFAQCCTDPNHQFGKQPEDYTLFCIGEFDDETGDIAPLAARSLGNGVIHIRREDPNAQVSDDSPVLASTAGGDPA